MVIDLDNQLKLIILLQRTATLAVLFFSTLLFRGVASRRNMEVSTMAFNLNGLTFQQSILDACGCPINTWADILNRANLGMKVMYERNAHNFTLDLACDNCLLCLWPSFG